MSDLFARQKLTFEDWLVRLAAAFAIKAPLEGAGYVNDCGVESWRDYYEDGFSPEDAADEDMSYWDDD